MTATLSMMSLSNSTVPSTGVDSNFCVTLHSGRRTTIMMSAVVGGLCSDSDSTDFIE